MQVPVPSGLFLCFGARVPDGFGICYNPLEKQVIFCVSSFCSSPDTDTILFLKTLCEVLVELRDVLQEDLLD